MVRRGEGYLGRHPGRGRTYRHFGLLLLVLKNFVLGGRVPLFLGPLPSPLLGFLSPFICGGVFATLRAGPES